MKVLWYVNIVMPAAAKRLNLPVLNVGGWLEGQSVALADIAQLTVVAVSGSVTEIKKVQVNNIGYVVLPSSGNFIEMFKDTYDTVSPDLVHIHGTEFKYNTDLIQYCNSNNIKNVVSIQGLAFECANHYFDGLPEKFKKENPAITLMRKVYTAESIVQGYNNFKAQGKNEIKALKTAKNVIGRTHWDKACVLSVNPDIQYFHVNENLRDEFYTGDVWSYEDCEKHSIFVSQAFYPIKGFHQLLKALNEVKKTYPDVKVYVAGYLPYTLNNKFLDVFVDYFFEYQGYIKKLIKKYNLGGNIIYTGPLSAQQMKERYLKCNVFVSASTIENSPNSVGEAMILGTPVVASNVGGVSTIMVDGTDGVLYDFYDNDKLSASIVSIFANETDTDSRCNNARNHALKTHNKNNNTDALLKVYSDIIN